MKIGIVKEQADARVSVVPDLVRQLTAAGNEFLFEPGCGHLANFSDQLYFDAGATEKSRREVLSSCDILISIYPPALEDMASMKANALLISQFQPYFSLEKVNEVAEHKLSAISLDMIPRITIAQSMDVLSSMASIAGYKAVLMAAGYLPRYFPMLTTAAGSIPPARVLIIGAGVAGLQAIATARRLGAIVEASDTRAAAKEEVQSLGAKFIEVEGAKDDKSAGGYAVEQTEEFKQKQKALLAERAAAADVIITTAQVRGKAAPRIISREMVDQMKPGSVIIDLASSTGGNCEMSKDKETVIYNGVTIIGDSDLAATVPQHASQLFSKNVQNFLKVCLKEKELELDLNNEILKSAVVVYEGQVLYK
ncbi:MAG: Re/Si-specific NAD(P)(+) transhydrogenase subunit alpha [Cyclobacteriaceae bacterium]|nr:Re/Si-specific NAD(P)(+) transhydrogenase subunit alpha [Cyclobacteriaceae bacterium]